MRVPRSIRRLTDPLLTRLRVPVVSGVNRGRYWSLVSAGSGYVSGRRAAGEMRLLSALIQPGDVVWDVGAHHGYVTLCASRRVGEGGRVHAFEPSRRNRGILERHVRWNRCQNVSVHAFALSVRDGEERLGGEGTSKTLALGQGSEVVAVRSAATLVRQGVVMVPTFLKIDVEGAEGDVIAGAMEILPRDARLFVEVHSSASDKRCCELLLGAGFHLHESTGLKSMRAGDDRKTDADLYCAGPEYEHWERDSALLKQCGF